MTKMKDVEYLDAFRRNKCKGCVCKSKSLTEQQWKETQDINNIVMRYVGTGMTFQTFLNRMDELKQAENIYLDVSEIQSLDDIKARMDHVTSAFEKNVPARIRDAFGNDPTKLIRYMHKYPDKFREMMLDRNNYSVPNVEQLEQAPHDVHTSEDEKK